jgi:pyrroline-5-carboxylate reductase
MRIGAIGTGTIATALVEGIAGDGHEITVSTRSEANSRRLAAAFDCVSVADNQGVVDASDVLFLGLMADAAPEILGALTFRMGQSVVSLMAGAGFEAVAGFVAPATLSAIMMPFPSIAKGGSPILAFGDCALVEEILGARNQIFALDSETDLAAYLCAQAVLSPAVRMVHDAATWLGGRVSDREMPERFLRSLVGTSLLQSSCSALLNALDTPGGYNRRLREHMVASGMPEHLHSGLDRLLR